MLNKKYGQDLRRYRAAVDVIVICYRFPPQRTNSSGASRRRPRTSRSSARHAAWLCRTSARTAPSAARTSSRRPNTRSCCRTSRATPTTSEHSYTRTSSRRRRSSRSSRPVGGGTVTDFFLLGYPLCFGESSIMIFCVRPTLQALAIFCCSSHSPDTCDLLLFVPLPRHL